MAKLYAFNPASILKGKRGRPCLSDEEKERRRLERLEKRNQNNETKQGKRSRKVKKVEIKTDFNTISQGSVPETIKNLERTLGISVEEMPRDELIYLLGYVHETMLRMMIIHAKERKLWLKLNH